MGQVESSDLDSTQDTVGRLDSPGCGDSRRVSGVERTYYDGLDTEPSDRDHAVSPLPFHRTNNVVSNNERARTESESTGGNTSSATDLSIPAIVISECSDAETDIEFDPAFFHTSEKKVDVANYLNGQDMELNITPHENDRRPSRIRIAGQNRGKSVDVSKDTRVSGHDKSMGSTSDASDKTSVSSKGSIKLKKSKQKKEKPDKTKKKLFGKNKGSLTDRWQNVVTEFEGNYAPASTKPEPKPGRKVSRLSMEKYDSVKQVFSRSMPLPMQTAPPGASAAQIEIETSTTAAGAYNSGKPDLSSSPRTSRKSSTAVNARSATAQRSSVAQRQSTQLPVVPATGGLAADAAKADRRKSRVESERTIREESRQEYTTRGSDAGRAGSVASIKSAQSQSRNRGSSASQTSVASKKGVKFRSRSLTLEDKAQIIVDDAIRAALGILGYKNASSYSSNSRKKSQSSSSNRESKESRESVNTSSTSRLMSERLSIEERERQRLHATQAKRGEQSRSSEDTARYGQFLNSTNRQEHLSSEHYERRKSSFSPRYNDQRRMSRMRILPGSGTGNKLRPANSLGDLYDMTIQPHTEKPDPEVMPRSAYVTANTMVRLYGEKDGRKQSVCGQMAKAQSETAINYQESPPTITRGTVTRVLHGLDNETRTPTASELLAELKTEENYDYSTWPLAKPEKLETNINMAEIRDDMTCHSLPEAGTLGLSFEHDEQLHRAASTGNLTVIADLPEHYTLKHSPSVPHIHEDEFIITRRAHSADNLLHMPYRDYSNPVSLQSGVSAPIYFMGPSGNYIPVYQGGWDGGQGYGYTEEQTAGAYSNEPIIVADLLEKTEPATTYKSYSEPTTGLTHRSYSEPAINMNRQQSLNLYLFNRPEAKSVDASFESQPYQDFDYQNFQNQQYYNQNYSQNYQNQQSPDAYDEYDFDSTDMREVTIFHKQTQTPPKPKKKPPVIRKIERRENARPVPVPIYLPKPKHRETTHYITKERQIERMPPEPVARSTFATQTENRQRGQIATQTDPPPPRPPKPKVDRVEFTRTIQQPTVKEMREMIGCSESRPSQHVPDTARNITVSKKPSYFDMNEVLERERQSQIVKHESQVAPPPEDEDSEEEMHELIEVEEKEQRIAMSIFEEFEFHFQRKEDGKVTDTQSGRASDLVPWIFPDKYEAVVDHRKQKSTQIREVDRTGGHSFHLVHPDGVPGGLPQITEQPHNSASQPGHNSQHNSSRQHDSRHNSQHNSSPGHNSQHNSSPGHNSQHNSQSHNSPNQPKHNSHHNSSAQASQNSQNSTRTDLFRQQTTYTGVPEVAKGSSKETINQEVTATWGVPGKSPPGYASAHSQGFRQEFVQKERSVGNPKMPSGPPSSGYSSADSLGVAARASSPTRRLHDAYNDTNDEANTRSNENKTTKSKYISRFDPDNIFFQVPEWTSMDSKDTMYQMSHSGTGPQKTQERKVLESRVESSSNPMEFPSSGQQMFHHEDPMLNTRYVKDKDGNLIKITEFENKRSETVEYEDEATRPWGVEQMPATDYLDVNLLSQPVVDSVEVLEQADDGNDSDSTIKDYGPEVTSETSHKLEPVAYSEQVRTLGIAEPDDVELQLRLREYEEKEKTLGIMEDDSMNAARQTEQYLYDARTATLRPVVTQDKGGRKLMQYSIGDTMITEL